ncbi:hypothetical protein OS493_017399 [Desmophyllum pertusum]|uniref:Uncharacterized protein n=1 Tax=Desmophyllum pertusum TaxID=174260 RepID=A0A9X0A1E1_9CNID|nr:hypothetical protein OS493_017399 [Desmophyllum pertusum]
MRRAMMKTVLLVLSLVFLVPTFSYPVGGDDNDYYYKDCLNCLNCVNNTCRSCEEGYAVQRVYTRRFCVSQCHPPNETPYLEKIWDPVLRSYICDKKRDCSSFLGSSERHCVECLASGSCVKCKENFALKLWDNMHTGYNLCVRSCRERCVVNGTLVCKTSAVPCAAGEAQLTIPSPAVVTGPTKTTVDSSQTNRNPEPITDGTHTDYNGYTEPTEDGNLDDDY